jgi:hypothetical protein
MSWEIMSVETHPCECGTGTETFTLEIDDWNRMRTSIKIQCSQCHEKRQRQLDAEHEREQRREELLQTAQQIARERYLAKWLSRFTGMTKQAAWKLYTGGSGYPGLGTFYQHVKDTGSLVTYMEQCLTSDLERSLRVLETKDGEIDVLLKERADLWRPTGGPL